MKRPAPAHRGHRPERRETKRTTSDEPRLRLAATLPSGLVQMFEPQAWHSIDLATADNAWIEIVCPGHGWYCQSSSCYHARRLFANTTCCHANYRTNRVAMPPPIRVAGPNPLAVMKAAIAGSHAFGPAQAAVSCWPGCTRQAAERGQPESAVELVRLTTDSMYHFSCKLQPQFSKNPRRIVTCECGMNYVSVPFRKFGFPRGGG